MADSVIVASSLVKTYGGVNVVDGVRFEVSKGKCFGFLGPNGAGKTSIMRMIYCATPRSAGELEVLGLDVEKDPKKVKARIGVVPQVDGLDVDFSVRENLIVYSRYHHIPHSEAIKRTDNLIEMMELTEHKEKKVEHLSGGLKRRLVIARALINNPELVVLDEPTTGLDPQARLWIWEKLSELKKKGITILLTTHYMEEAEKLCDELVIMDKGKFLVEGTPEDLIRDLVGHEVVEISVEDNDVESVKSHISDNYDFQILRHHMRVFIKEGQDGKVLMNALMGDQIMIRKASLDDVFLKLSGYELRD